jgi:hypothetical protein
MSIIRSESPGLWRGHGGAGLETIPGVPLTLCEYDHMPTNLAHDTSQNFQLPSVYLVPNFNCVPSPWDYISRIFLYAKLHVTQVQIIKWFILGMTFGVKHVESMSTDNSLFMINKGRHFSVYIVCIYDQNFKSEIHAKYEGESVNRSQMEVKQL